MVAAGRRAIADNLLSGKVRTLAARCTNVRFTNCCG